MVVTPPRPVPSLYIDEAPETPGPVRARVNNLQNQVSELVRKEHAATRKHRSEVSSLETSIAAQQAQLASTEWALKEVQGTLAATQKELARCKSEGDGMRDVLNLHSVVQQQRALLALAQEQMQVVELEQRLVQAEAARIMRDHKLALFQAKEDDLVSELAERDARLEELEASLDTANTSLSHERAALDKAARQELKAMKEDKVALMAKVELLEGSVRALKEREKEARAELEGWLREEKSKENGLDGERRELQVSLRNTKAELAKKTEELVDLQEEMAQFKETSKQREQHLKAKARAAIEERDKLAGVEVELESLRQTAASAQAQAKKAEEALRAASEGVPPEEESPSKRTSPAKKAAIKASKAKEKARKISPISEGSDDEVVPKKKARKPSSDVPTSKKRAEKAAAESSEDEVPAPKKKREPALAKEKKGPLIEFNEENIVPAKDKTEGAFQSTGKDVDAEQDEVPGRAGGGPEKKKKRKLLGTQPTFSWDPIMNSGDGVIPLTLSPMKPTNGPAKGVIPRVGFPSVASSRLGRF